MANEFFTANTSVAILPAQSTELSVLARQLRKPAAVPLLSKGSNGWYAKNGRILRRDADNSVHNDFARHFFVVVFSTRAT